MLKVPLHTIFKLTLVPSGIKVERNVVPIEAVDIDFKAIASVEVCIHKLSKYINFNEHWNFFKWWKYRRRPFQKKCTWCFLLLLLLLGFTTLFNILVISVTSDIEHEKSDKFCSEALISDWVSFMCRISTTRDSRLYFPSEGSHTQDFYALKKSIDPGRDRTREPRIQRRVW